MQVEALIATMDRKNDSILSEMNIQSDALVVNQCDHFSWSVYERNGHQVRFLSMAERGVGLSRNTALMRAGGDICLFSDDDLVYCNDYAAQLQEAFQRYPMADVIVFNIQSIQGRKKRYMINRVQRVRWYNFMRYGAARIAVRREQILKKNISFSLLFGGGAPYSSGEDTIFLHDCLQAGLKIYAVPLLLAQIDDSSSTWFRGYTEQFFRDRGALHEAVFGRLAGAENLAYLLMHRHIRSENGGLLYALRLMCRGSKDFRKDNGQ